MRIDYSDSYHIDDVVDRINECLALLSGQIESLEAKISMLEANHKELIERIDCLTGDPETLI